jgi:DNA gyrase subunit B
MVWALVDNAIAEFRAGFARYVRITIEGSTIAIEDDGRGIPVESIRGRSALEHVWTGERPGGCAPRRRLSHPHAAAVTALCERLDVEVQRGGRRYAQSYGRGLALAPMRDLGETTGRGTHIRFAPDRDVTGPVSWDRAAIAARLRELAALAPGLTCILDHDAWCSPGGLVDHVQYLANDPALDVTRLAGTCGDVEVEVALAWQGERMARVTGYVFDQPAIGDHVDGLLDGVHAALCRIDPRVAVVSPRALSELARGLVALVRVETTDPVFSGQAHTQLAMPRVRAAVAKVVSAQLVMTPSVLPRLPS